MSADQDAAARRIMDQFGEESRIPYLNIEEGDVGMLIAFPIIGLFIAGLTGIESLALPFVAGGLGFGVAVIYVSPTHLNAWTWTKDVYRYLKRPQVTFSAPADADTSTNESERNEGGLANYTPFQPDERTQDLTNIKRAWPGAGAIQREDGAMEAFIEIDPANMDFAMSDDWAQLRTLAKSSPTKSWTRNSNSTPQPVHFRWSRSLRPSRIDSLTKMSQRTRSSKNSSRSTGRHGRRRCVTGVSSRSGTTSALKSARSKCTTASRDEGTPVEKLTQFPVIGFLFNPFVTRREDLTDVERRAQMFEKLDSRVNDVRSELIQQASGWSARRLSTVELFVLNMDFWNGREHDYDEAERVVRDQSIIGHSRREDPHDA